MEPIQTDYRLERRMAFLLALLFFLPFVARADDILYATERYHAEEMPYADGEEFLALTSTTLIPTRITVIAAPDLGDKPGEMSGREVSVPVYPEVYLLRSKALHAGEIAQAKPYHAHLIPDIWNATFTLGELPYDLWYRCGEAECTMVLEQGERSQDLMTIPITREGKEVIPLGVVHYIVFAGDLDDDGRLDLVANLARHWWEWRPVLLLSSAAKDGEIVGLAAELPTSDC